MVRKKLIHFTTLANNSASMVHKKLIHLKTLAKNSAHAHIQKGDRGSGPHPPPGKSQVL